MRKDQPFHGLPWLFAGENQQEHALTLLLSDGKRHVTVRGRYGCDNNKYDNPYYASEVKRRNICPAFIA